MQQLVGNNYGAYSFNPVAKTITIVGIDDVLKLEQIQMITNVTTNIIIYAFAISGKGGSVSNNVITLDFDTSTMASTDNLAILVNTPSRDTELLKTLSKIARLLEASSNVDPATLAQKVAVANTHAVTVSSGTITTLTNLTNRITANVDQINGTDSRFLLADQSKAAFNLNIRSKYTFT